MKWIITSLAEMNKLGQELAQILPLPFCLELVGDVGAGKTTLTKALVAELGSVDEVTSPSFTINNRYQLTDGREVSHYDFYRLGEAGVLSQELMEDLADPRVSVIIEWAETVKNLLPSDCWRVVVTVMADDSRQISLERIDG